MSNLFKLLQILADVGFNEADHPRGQPGNRGEFAPKHGSKTSKSTPEHKPAKNPSTNRSQLLETKVVDGKRVTHDGKPLPEHIEKLRIPPAWVNVKINHDPDAGLLATGFDSKGRQQSVYNAKLLETNAQEKFARIDELINNYDKIYKQNEENRTSHNLRTKDNADVAKLIFMMGLRPGSDSKDTQAEQQAYGATTLEGKHIVEENGETKIKFIGKKGVKINLKVNDPGLAKMLKERAKTAGSDGKLFPHTNEKHLLNYVHTFGGYKTKDFRTRLGTQLALDMVANMPKPANEKEYKKAVMNVGKHVASHLGNTGAIALAAYINPTVFSKWII